MGTILDVYEPQSVATCGQASDCQFTIDWNYLISPNACEIVDFFDATLAAAGTSLCYSWDFGDGGFSNLQNPQHIYGASGVYTVCLTVECCDDPTGASKQTLCKDVTIDCDDPCVPDAAFSMMDLGDCCYEFMDLTPSSVPGMSCQEWEILDASGNHIVTGVMGSSFVHCFTADGTYTICYVDCCVNPDGTITYATVCQDLVVDCACEEYPGAINTAILSQTCDDLVIGIWLNPALAADYCVDFIYDGVHYTSTYDATSGTYSVTIPTPCPGDYFGEILVYCCDDPTIVISHIMDFTVDHECCCEVDPTFVIDQIDDCCFAFADLTPDADDSCNEWTVTDASGAIIAGFIGDSWTYCFPANGVYTVCNRDCCIQSDGTVIDEIHCEQVIVTNCGCDLPNADELTLVLVNNDVNCKQIGACVNFLDGTGLGSEYCIDWNWGDGSSQTNSADFCPFHEFECNGAYIVCATIYCCEDPSVSITLCGEVVIDCPCVVPADINFDLVMNADCSASVIISTPTDPCPQDLCYDWILPAGVAFNGAGNLVFPGNGVYTLCLWVYCCDDTTIGYEVCQTVTIDCYCEVDPHFVIDPIDDCCFAFADLTPDTDDNCNQWSIYDEFGNLIAGFVGDFWTYCFDANGVYTVCNTDCCVLPDGTIDYVDYCDQLVVTNCGCELPNADELALVVVNDDVNCKQIGACVNFVDGTGLGSEYCIDWSWGDGSGQSNPADFCPFHDYACNGVYEVCAKIYCCEDPTDVIEICRQVVIECPCDLPTGINFDVLVNDDCTATPLVVFPDVPCPDEVCTEWILPVGVTQNAVTGNFEFPGDGNYTICLSVFCCDFPSVGYVICHDITIDCACELPNDADLELNLVGSDINCKSLGACVLFPVGTDVASLCIDWSWGDGSTQTESAAFCPLHNYACSGVYDVCATIYCCDDPTNVVTICGVYTIDCPCDLPSVEFNVNVNDDCSADADLIFGADIVCPEEICFEWTVVEPGVGVVSTGTGAHFDFPGDGVYQICLTVFCCNDPSINYSLCQLVDIDCPCVLPDDLEMEVVQHTDTHCREIGVCVIAIGGGNDTYCVDYSWGDGNTTSGTLDFCPEYEYACNGTYTVCAEVYCCNDPANRLTICKEVVIDCPCVLPQVGFSVVVNDDCTATPVIELPIDPCDEVCFSYFSPSPGVVYNAGTGQFEFPGSGTYQVCVDVFCCNGTGLGYSLCEDVTVECGCGVEADFNYDPANCSVYFVDQSIVDAGGVITSWNWTFGDGNTSNLNNPLHTYAVGGNYTVCLTVTAVFPDGSTCTDTFCQDIFVDCNDCDAFVMFTCDPAGCTITFNDVSTAGGGGVIIAWFWDFGDGNTSTLQFPTHTYGASGSYTVCLTVTVLMPDGTTCDKTFCNTTPYLNCDECNVFADFSYTPVDCSVSFTDLSFTGPGTNITGWFWNFGDSNSSNVQNPTHTFGASGTYTVCLTVFAVGPNGSQCSHFSCVEVTVDCDGDCPEPCELYPGFIYTIDPITSADGCCVQFFNNSYSGPYTTITGYLWDFGDGNGTMGMDPYHCYMSPGTYTVTLTVFGESSEGECAETYSFTVICDCEDTCPEDVDEDGHIGVSDLLAILGKFNQECE